MSTATAQYPYSPGSPELPPELRNQQDNLPPGNNPEKMTPEQQYEYFRALDEASHDLTPADFDNSTEGSGLSEQNVWEHTIKAANDKLYEGSLDGAQRTIEHAKAPGKHDNLRRDALAEIHMAEKGVPSKEVKNDALNYVKTEIGKDLSKLTDDASLSGEIPELTELRSTQEASDSLEVDYFDDSTSDDQNEKSPHQISEDSHEILLKYIDKKLRNPSLKPEFVEKLRVARDTLHLERKGIRSQFDAQNSLIESVNTLKSQFNNDVLSNEKVRKSLRSCRGNDLERAGKMIKVAETTNNPEEKDALLNDLENGAELAKNAEAFEAWEQRRADASKKEEEHELSDKAESARNAIENALK